ncbi:MAG: hypothetical protein L6R36_006149 [Xanthoria steineri]|nr:MAG: hypothetical protein L6R36_006149 [Xanthoria steineri]
MLQPRICLRQVQHLRPLLPYTPLRTYAEAQAFDHKPPPPITATSTQPEVNPYETSVRPEDTPEPPFQLRSYKPRTPGIRHLRRPINDHLHRGRAHLPLTFPRKGQHIGGRNNSGQIRVRHRGNGAKRRIRTVDFHRFAPGKHTVERIEYDPGRSAHIALVHDNAAPRARKSYILAAQGMRAGDEVESFRAGVPRLLLEALGGSTDAGMIAAKTAWRGNCLPLHMIPTGTLSGEVRRIHRDACATIGTASNSNYNRRQLGKAGRSRWLGIRPTVRGVAMNASDHPHGGGRGKSKGNVQPVSIWGQLTKGGFKTRKKRNVNRFVVTPRPRGQKSISKAKKKEKKNKH